jgi:aryl-alcohol dehydrogenase-like predicted oxidoreductase
MEQRHLGRTGVSVSRLRLGAMMFGDAAGRPPRRPGGLPASCGRLEGRADPAR